MWNFEFFNVQSIQKPYNGMAHKRNNGSNQHINYKKREPPNKVHNGCYNKDRGNYLKNPLDKIGIVNAVFD